MQLAQRRDRDGADQGIGRGPLAAGEQHVHRRIVALVEHAGDLHRVRHHGKTGHRREVVGQVPGRGTGAQSDRHPRGHHGSRLARDRLLLRVLPGQLALEPGLVGAGSGREHSAAVHAAQQSARDEGVDVPSDRHLRHVERVGELRDPDRPVFASPVQDGGLPGGGQHHVDLTGLRVWMIIPCSLPKSDRRRTAAAAPGR